MGPRAYRAYRDILNYLASKYEKLYNSVEYDGSLFEIEEKLDSKIPGLNDQHINLLTSEITKTASQKLKHRKSDPQLSITSDFFVRTPPIFYDLLSSILKSYIVHAHVSDFLLLSNLIPIVKDKLGDITAPSQLVA